MFSLWLRKASSWGLLSVFLSIPISVMAADDLLDMELEALMDLEVTTVSKRVQPLSDSAAAIYVITTEEIRRSGATTIADALRLAPGVEVARLNGSTWAVSVRGLNSMYSHNLLVLVDGRSIYSPLYGGVYWDVAMPMLEDIDRVEVIRGPGASLWGVNAVNGVINIITKSAELTQGYRAVVAAGNEENHLRLRAGGKTGQVFYRGYVVHRDRDSNTDEATGKSAEDAMQGTQAGARADIYLGEKRLTLQADYSQVDKSYMPNIAELVPVTQNQFDNVNWNILTRWQQPVGEDSLQLQFYVDRTEREEPDYDYQVDTYDLDFQFNHSRYNGHRITWGINYRYFTDELKEFESTFLRENPYSWDLLSVFIQDELQLNERLTVIAGIKAEKVKNIDTAWQPTLRFNYRSSDRFSSWGSVSFAERIPTRQDLHAVYLSRYPERLREYAGNLFQTEILENLTPQEIFILTTIYPQLNFNNMDIYAELLGSEELKSEKTTSYELGARWQPKANLFFDLAAYYSVYRDLRSVEYVDWRITEQGDGVVTQLVATNLAEGESYGLELATELRPSKDWRFKFHYNYLQFIVENDNFLGAAEFIEDVSPSNQFSFRAYWDISDRYQWDVDLYYVDEITAVADNPPKDYADMNMRFAWRAAPQTELSLVVQNLFHEQRYEYQETVVSGPERTAIDRSIYLQIDWKQ